MPTTKPLPKEKSTFKIVNPETGASLQLTANGSVLHGIKEAFTCLPHARREKLLSMLNAEHQRLRPTEQTEPAGTNQC